MKKFGRRIETRGMGLLRAVGLMAIIVALAFGLAHGTQSRAHAPTSERSDVIRRDMSSKSPRLSRAALRAMGGVVAS